MLYRLRVVLALMVVIVGLLVGWFMVSSIKSALDSRAKYQADILKEIERGY